MTWFKDLEGKVVVGTVVPRPRPFVLNLETGEVTLDDHVGGAPQRRFTEEERAAIARRVREGVDFPVAEVRPGEYLCHTCKKWVDADGTQWSLGLCLSCSMDRDSDRWS